MVDVRKGIPVMLRLVFTLLAILFLITGCSREEVWEPEVVARVGNRTLTASEIATWEVSLRQLDIPQEVRSAFIRHWVEDELLFQASLELGLDEDPWVAQRLDEIKRSLLVSRLLEKEYRKITTVSPGLVHSYFKEHAGEFVWSHLHLVVDYWRSTDRKGMDRLRSNLQRGRQAGIWSGKVGDLESGRISLDGPESTAPEVWKVVSRMVVGQVSRVLHLNEDYWAFKLIDRREAGEPQGIDDVHDEIVQRLLEEARRTVKDELIRELIEEYRRSGKLQWAKQPRTPATAKSEEALPDTIDN